MKSNIVITLMALAAWSTSQAQLYVSPGSTLYIKNTGLFNHDGLILMPSAGLELTNISIRRSDTAFYGRTGNSINRVFFMSRPLNFSGIAGVRYLPNELAGNFASKLQLSHHSTEDVFENPAGSTQDSILNIVSRSFDAPEVLSIVTAAPKEVVLPSNGVSFDNIKTKSMRLRFRPKNGIGRVVFMKQQTAPNFIPIDGSVYQGNNQFGMGTPYAGSYVVYAGSADSVTVFNLQPKTRYYFMVYEYRIGTVTPDYETLGRKSNATTAADYVLLTKGGVGYRQNFDDSLTGDNLPVGWVVSAPYTTDDGSAATAGVKSYGAPGSNERALGSIFGNYEMYGAKFVNGSDFTFTSLLVRYWVEQWRLGGYTGTYGADSLIVEYSKNATSVNDPAATWHRAGKLNAISPLAYELTMALDGNASTFRKMQTTSIIDLPIGSGEMVFIRFRDHDFAAGLDDGLAIDDFEIVPFWTTVTGSTTIVKSPVNDLNIVSGQANMFVDDLTVRNALNISDSACLYMGPYRGQRLNIADRLYGTGYIKTSDSNDATITVGGNHLDQVLYFHPAGNTLQTLIIKGKASASLGSMLNIAARPDAGIVKIGNQTDTATLITNGNLRLCADSTGAATIAPIYGSLKGSIKLQSRLQHRAGVRLISHPFVPSIPISQIDDDFPLNTSGGLMQNLWYYDNQTSSATDVASLANKSTWSPVLATPGQNVSWNGVFRLLKESGSVMIELEGTPGQGDRFVDAFPANNNFILARNPYPAGVKLKNALDSAGTGFIASAIWTWDPTKASAGSFVTIPASKFKSAKLPVCGSFVGMAAPGSWVRFSFKETDKTVSGNSKTYLKQEDDRGDEALWEGLQLVISKGGREYDACYLYFQDEAASSSETGRDAPKINNPGLDLSSQASDNKDLSVDVRPFAAGKEVALSVLKAEPGTYSFRFADWQLAADKSLFLVDRYLGQIIPLAADQEYGFTVDGNENSQGRSRFALRMATANETFPLLSSGFELAPNPAKDNVSLVLAGKVSGNGSVRVLSLVGHELQRRDFRLDEEDRITVCVSSLAPGSYLVELNLNEIRSVQKLIKQ